MMFRNSFIASCNLLLLLISAVHASLLDEIPWAEGRRNIMEYFAAARSTTKITPVSDFFENTLDGVFLLGNPKTIVGRHTAFENTVIKEFPTSVLSKEVIKYFAAPLNKGNEKVKMKLGEFSLNLKHIFAAYLIVTEYSLKNSPGYFLVMEDDAHPIAGFVPTLRRIQAQLQNKSWHSVMLGGCGRGSHGWVHSRGGVCESTPHLRNCSVFRMPSKDASRCTIGILWSYLGAQALLDHSLSWHPIDFHLNMMGPLVEGYGAYWAEPWLVHEGMRNHGFFKASHGQSAHVTHDEVTVLNPVAVADEDKVKSPCAQLPPNIAIISRHVGKDPSDYRKTIASVASLPSDIPRLRLQQPILEYLSHIVHGEHPHDWVISIDEYTNITNATRLCEHVNFMHKYGFEYSGSPDGGFHDFENGWPSQTTLRKSPLAMNPSFNVFNTKRIREIFALNRIKGTENQWMNFTHADFSIMDHKIPSLFGSYMHTGCSLGQCEPYYHIYINLLAWCIPLYLRPIKSEVGASTTITIQDQNSRSFVMFHKSVVL